MNVDLTKSLFNKLKRIDFLALFIQCLLLGLGVAFIYGTGVEIGGSFASKWSMQLVWIAAGFILYFSVALTDYRLLGRHSWLIFALSILGLLALFPFGSTINNARSWLKIPGIGFFQPAELVKPACLLFISWIATRHVMRYSLFPIALPVTAITLIPFFLVCMQPDFGTALVFIPSTAAIIYLTGARWRWIICFACLVLLLAPLTFSVLKPHQKERLKVFLEPPAQGSMSIAASILSEEKYEQWKQGVDNFFRPPEGTVRDRWNSQQSLLAVGSGGLTGKGFMKGTQHVLGYLPKNVAPTDFIFSVISEETGFVGAGVLLLLFACLLLCYCRTALMAGKPMGTCIACGTAVIFLTHIAINIGMTVQAAPIIGIPLPFVSYGGSFMLGTMLLAGLVQSVHIHRKINNLSSQKLFELPED